MLETMLRYLEGVHPVKTRRNLQRIFQPSIDTLSSQPLTTAGLVITGGGGTTAKIGGADFYASVIGTLVKIAASTSMPALTGCNFDAGKFNVACFYVDYAGVVTMLYGTQGAAVGNVVFPEPPKNKALVGFLILTNAGAFTGGSTAIDGGTTTVYVSPLGPFDPTALTG